MLNTLTALLQSLQSLQQIGQLFQFLFNAVAVPPNYVTCYNPHTHTHRTRRRRTQFERKQGSNKFMMMKYSVASMTHCAKKRRNSPICILSRSGCNLLSRKLFIIVRILILFIHFTSNYYYITPFGSDDESIVYERRKRKEEEEKKKRE